LPGGRRHYWYYAPLMPLAIEQLDLGGYDLILSSSHAVALGVLTAPEQLHVSYMHSPMRFAWDLQGLYLDAFGFRAGVKTLAARLVFHYLRLWDRGAHSGVDRFVANSAFVASRIRKVYRRESTVLAPPVDVGRFALQPDKGETFLAGSRMNPFKRIDLVVDAFTRLLADQRLVVVGDGPDLEKIRALAGPNVELVGHVPDAELTRRMQEAAAFVHAATEDFGIAMAEAQACGTPVIAFDRGGAREIVAGLDGPAPTGVLFGAQTAEGVAEGVRGFLAARERINPAICREGVMHLAPERFREAYRAVVEEAWAEFEARGRLV
ncbi:MAG: glycosyltransferase, partial [Solirubrobacteraceae bacterium]|nr:glycosyltransferase [Solirubrobacteraceae bacterium]